MTGRSLSPCIARDSLILTVIVIGAHGRRQKKHVFCVSAAGLISATTPLVSHFPSTKTLIKAWCSVVKVFSLSSFLCLSVLWHWLHAERSERQETLPAPTHFGVPQYGYPNAHAENVWPCHAVTKYEESESV